MKNDRAIVPVVERQECRREWERWTWVSAYVKRQACATELKDSCMQCFDGCKMCFPSLFQEESRYGSLGDPVGRDGRHVLEEPRVHRFLCVVSSVSPPETSCLLDGACTVGSVSFRGFSIVEGRFEGTRFQLSRWTRFITSLKTGSPKPDKLEIMNSQDPVTF